MHHDQAHDLPHQHFQEKFREGRQQAFEGVALLNFAGIVSSDVLFMLWWKSTILCGGSQLFYMCSAFVCLFC